MTQRNEESTSVQQGNFENSEIDTSHYENSSRDTFSYHLAETGYQMTSSSSSG